MMQCHASVQTSHQFDYNSYVLLDAQMIHLMTHAAYTYVRVRTLNRSNEGRTTIGTILQVD